VHDTEAKTWRHLDFFQHQAYLHARVPRVRCPTHGVRQVQLAWARPGSGFTLLFEALLLEFAPHMPVAAIARMVDEHDTRIWRVLEHYVAAARADLDLCQVRNVGMDETSARRGQDYVSLFMDLDATPRVVFATEGRDAATVKGFGADLLAHGGQPGQVTKVCCDMSPAFIRGVAEQLPNAEITFDRYHVIAALNTAVDEVRKAERRTAPELARSKYLWLKRPERLNERQAETLAWLTRPSSQLATARAYRWRWDFDGFYDQPPEQAEAYLTRWCRGAIRSRQEPLKKIVRMVRAHWDGIVARHRTVRQQRHPRGHQQPGPGGQTQGTRLPQQAEDDHHRLPHRRPLAPTHHPHNLARSLKLSLLLPSAGARHTPAYPGMRARAWRCGDGSPSPKRR